MNNQFIYPQSLSWTEQQWVYRLLENFSAVFLTFQVILRVQFYISAKLLDYEGLMIRSIFLLALLNVLVEVNLLELKGICRSLGNHLSIQKGGPKLNGLPSKILGPFIRKTFSNIRITYDTAILYGYPIILRYTKTFQGLQIPNFMLMNLWTRSIE